MTKNIQQIIKVVIIEDNRYMREGWETILDLEDDMLVLDTFETCEKAFASDLLPKTDFILMDIDLPGMSGIKGVKYVRKHHPDIDVVMATIFDDDTNIFNALCAGAVGYLMKKVSPDELKASIREAYNGGSPMTPNVARKVISSFQQSAVGDSEDELNDRELEILKQLAKGKSYSAIGETIFLSTDGVRYHIRNIYRKLQVNSRSEAVSIGISRRLINPDVDS